MNTLTVTGFRNNLASLLNRADAGEEIYFNRGSRRYRVQAVEDSGRMSVTPALLRRAEEAEEELRKGNCTILKSHEDIVNFAKSLMA